MSVTADVSQFLWVEKYRPRTISECILPDRIKSTAQGYISQGRIPHMLFTGTAGVGKTTLAKAICNEVGADFILINASNESGIDTLRTKITQFASTVSFSNAKKVVILDEADYLNMTSTQPALRAFMEQFSANCTFILTCNFKSRLMEPIHSRCQVIDFKLTGKERAGVASQFFKRVTSILGAEGVTFNRDVVADVVKRYFPDFRKTLNELQSYSAAGSIDSGILVNLGDEAYDELFKALASKKFNDMRKWVAAHGDEDSTAIFTAVYEKIGAKIAPKSMPAVILLIADYQYKAAFVANQEINLVAFFTELLMNSDIQWS